MAECFINAFTVVVKRVGGGVNMLLPRWFENVGFFARIDTKKATGR
jgi:hypothetical protein